MKKIFIVNNAEPGIVKFAQDIAGILLGLNIHYDILQYHESSRILKAQCKGVIMSGSPQGDDIVVHHLPFFQWLKEFDKPVLGICAGHHILGTLYGSELLKSREPESGDCIVEIVKDDPIFQDMPRCFKVKQMHNDSITVPVNFDLLASSGICNNQLMKLKRKPVYSCQFHPEYYNGILIRNFLDMAGKY